MVLAETALALARSAALGEIKKRIAGFLDKNTAAVKDAFAAAVADWAIEARARAEEVADQSAADFVDLDGRLENLDETLRRALGDAPVLLCAIYESEAARESMEERRRMLAHAAAAIGDLTISFEDKCRAERAMRSLFPSDVIVLDQLHRLVGDVERLSGGAMGRNHRTDGAFRAARLHASKSAAPLLVSGCVRERVGDRVRWGEGAFAEVVVTPIGELVLYVLRSFLATRRATAPGREHVPGERGEASARELMGASFVDAVRRACFDVRGFAFDPYTPVSERDRRVQFDVPRPVATALESHEHPLREIAADAPSKLHVFPVPDEIARAIPTPGRPLALSVAPIADKQGFSNVRVEGPFDVLRWLAEDVSAWWT